MAPPRNQMLQVSLSVMVVAMGVCAAVVILSARDLQRRPSELVQVTQQLAMMGVGAEDWSDNQLKMALGKDGDIAKDVQKETDEAVKKAMEETQKGVDEEINSALADGEANGKAGYEADIAKYKGQEAGYGHKGWIQSWANPMREAGLPVEGLAKLAAGKQQMLAQTVLYEGNFGIRGSSAGLPLPL